MDKAGLLKIRHELLGRMTAEFQENLIPAQVNMAEDVPDLEILTVLFDDIGRGDEETYGEFYFTPLQSEEDEVQYFTGMITLLDDLDEAYLPVLYEAMSYINFQIPVGTFMIDKTHRFLSFKVTAPMPVDEDDKVLFDQASAVASNAVLVADVYAGVLLDVASGAATIDNVVEILGEA